MEVIIQKLQRELKKGGEAGLHRLARHGAFSTSHQNARLSSNEVKERKAFNRASSLFAAALVAPRLEQRVPYLRSSIYAFQESLVKEPGLRAIAKTRKEEVIRVLDTVDKALRGDYCSTQLVDQLAEAYLSGQFSCTVSDNEAHLDYSQVECHSTSTRAVSSSSGHCQESCLEPESFLDPVTKKKRKILHHKITAPVDMNYDRACRLAKDARHEMNVMLQNIVNTRTRT